MQTAMSSVRALVKQWRVLYSVDGCYVAAARQRRWDHLTTGTCLQSCRPFSAQAEAAPDPTRAISLDDSAVKKLREVLRDTPGQVLRLSVDSGGCSGFQYVFTLDQKPSSDDLLVQEQGVTLAVDKVSMEFVKGATIEYAEDLLSSSFRVRDNPIAEQACGCGSSFAAKMDWA